MSGGAVVSKSRTMKVWVAIILYFFGLIGVVPGVIFLGIGLFDYAAVAEDFAEAMWFLAGGAVIWLFLAVLYPWFVKGYQLRYWWNKKEFEKQFAPCAAHFASAPDLQKELRKQRYEKYCRTGDAFDSYRGMPSRLLTDAQLRKFDRTLSLLLLCCQNGGGMKAFLEETDENPRKYYGASEFGVRASGLFSPGLQFLWERMRRDTFFNLYDNGLSEMRSKAIAERTRLLDKVYFPVLLTFREDLEAAQEKVRSKLPQET